VSSTALAHAGVLIIYSLAELAVKVFRDWLSGGPLTTIGTLGGAGYYNGSQSQSQFNYPTGLSGRVETGIYLNPYNVKGFIRNAQARFVPLVFRRHCG
jgi:hypothetical protein